MIKSADTPLLGYSRIFKTITTNPVTPGIFHIGVTFYLCPDGYGKSHAITERSFSISALSSGFE